MRSSLLLVLVLAGCAPVQQAEDQLVNTFAGASDQARETSELVLCRGITVGAWVRAYGSNPERAAAWRTLCSNQVKETP